VDALKVYAAEYGAFINILAEGWNTLDDPETAQEEQEHAELWEGFAVALETEVKDPKIEQTIALVSTATELFRSRAKTLGAMYAEAQQPGPKSN
jgi:pyrroloquinoline-quinone synthase